MQLAPGVLKSWSLWAAVALAASEGAKQWLPLSEPYVADGWYAALQGVLMVAVPVLRVIKQRSIP